MKYRLLIIVGVLLDQLIKLWAQNQLGFFKCKVAIDSLLSFQLVHNYGAAYGIFQNQRWFLVAFALIVIVLVSVFYKHLVNGIIGRWGISIFLIGAIGNFLDRLVRGYVIDYVVTPFFPVFNFADFCIDVGILLLFLDIFMSRPKKADVKS